MTTERCKFCGLEAGKVAQGSRQTPASVRADLEICPLPVGKHPIDSLWLSTDTTKASEWNKAWAVLSLAAPLAHR